MNRLYTRAVKVLGRWTILLTSQQDDPKAIAQFSSLSRKAANIWSDINEPLPATYQLNATAGATVWRARAAA